MWFAVNNGTFAGASKWLSGWSSCISTQQLEHNGRQSGDIVVVRRRRHSVGVSRTTKQSRHSACVPPAAHLTTAPVCLNARDIETLRQKNRHHRYSETSNIFQFFNEILKWYQNVVGLVLDFNKFAYSGSFFYGHNVLIMSLHHFYRAAWNATRS